MLDSIAQVMMPIALQPASVGMPVPTTSSVGMPVTSQPWPCSTRSFTEPERHSQQLPTCSPPAATQLHDFLHTSSVHNGSGVHAPAASIHHSSGVHADEDADTESSSNGKGAASSSFKMDVASSSFKIDVDSDSFVTTVEGSRDVQPIRSVPNPPPPSPQLKPVIIPIIGGEPRRPTELARQLTQQYLEQARWCMLKDRISVISDIRKGVAPVAASEAEQFRAA